MRKTEAIVRRSVREYLGFLLENGVEEVRLPEASGRRRVGERLTTSQSDSGIAQGEEGLVRIRRELEDCNRCPLAGGRQKLVFGEGNPRAQIVLVGEGPGGEEDRVGRPFVGPAGQLLNRMIENAMGIRREEVYICNIVKCRPPGNRTPSEEEIRACLPFLERQIESLGPKVIVTLGQPATCALLGIRKPIHLLRGKWQSYRGIPLMPTFHPAYVLRQYTVPIRRLVFEDIQQVVNLLGLPGKKPG